MQRHTRDVRGIGQTREGFLIQHSIHLLSLGIIATLFNPLSERPFFAVQQWLIKAGAPTRRAAESRLHVLV